MPRILALLAAAALSLGARRRGIACAAQQAPTIPPLKGEVGEQSEPGGVGRPARTARSRPRRPQPRAVRLGLSSHCRHGAPAGWRRQSHGVAGEPGRGDGAARPRRQCGHARGRLQGPRLRGRHAGNIGGSSRGAARNRQAHAIRCRGRADIGELHRVRSRRRALCADCGADCRQWRAGHGRGPWRCCDDQSDQRMGRGAHARAHSLHHRACAAGTRARRA